MEVEQLAAAAAAAAAAASNQGFLVVCVHESVCERGRKYMGGGACEREMRTPIMGVCVCVTSWLSRQ